MNFDVKQLSADTDGRETIFSYEGDVSSERINFILEGIENKFVELSSELKVRKKIYNIMVEALQNLFHHSDDVPGDLVEKIGKRFGVIILAKTDNSYVLTAGNFIKSEKVAFLTEKIEKINSLSKDELKEMYKFILNFQKISAKGGGGLGLIDIARRSENKLGYKFYPYNENYCFYRLDIFVTN